MTTIAAIMVLVGFAAVIAACAMIGAWLALLAFGLGLMTVGFLIDEPGRRKP